MEKSIYLCVAGTSDEYHNTKNELQYLLREDDLLQVEFKSSYDQVASYDFYFNKLSTTEYLLVSQSLTRVVSINNLKVITWI